MMDIHVKHPYPKIPIRDKTEYYEGQIKFVKELIRSCTENSIFTDKIELLKTWLHLINMASKFYKLSRIESSIKPREVDTNERMFYRELETLYYCSYRVNRKLHYQATNEIMVYTQLLASDFINRAGDTVITFP